MFEPPSHFSRAIERERYIAARLSNGSTTAVFRVARVNANPKTGEPSPQASREIASMQLS
jgi:hypothetical protein